jgi:hypothetical protein
LPHAQLLHESGYVAAGVSKQQSRKKSPTAKSKVFLNELNGEENRTNTTKPSRVFFFIHFANRRANVSSKTTSKSEQNSASSQVQIPKLPPYISKCNVMCLKGLCGRRFDIYYYFLVSSRVFVIELHWGRSAKSHSPFLDCGYFSGFGQGF